MRYIIVIIHFFFSISFIQAQLIWTEPAFPIADEQVKVFFNAELGTAGLKDCNCDVYLHTGVITEKSNRPSDWKYVVTQWGRADARWKMQAVNGKPNIYSYEIAPSIRSYYNVPANEMIQKMAFVFRNANGSKEGKADGGSDIFYDVYPDNNVFTANFITPTGTHILAEKGSMINIKAVSSENASLRLMKDGQLLTSSTDVQLSYTLTASEVGAHEVIFEADNGTTTIRDTFVYTVPNPTETKALPNNIKLGINYTNDSTVVLALYAPGKKYVFLRGDFNDWQIREEYQLKNTPDGAIWWIAIEHLIPQREYAFQYFVDGKINIADPYSEKILDPWNDRYISSETYPNLKAYPFDGASGIVSVLQTAQKPYTWSDNDFIPVNKNKLIIYEMHLRDFLKSHSYRDLLDTLPYLERLGVSAIELMPVHEFEGNDSWGYNPSFHGALDKYYGTPEAFKDFINEAHRRGISVMLDVVYNHAFSQSPLAQLYWDDAKFRPLPSNPWLNPVARHPYNVGYDFNHESNATKTYVKQTLKTWIEKYHIDGFRFDLSKGFTQRQSNDNGRFSAYDAKRIATLKDYADFIWNLDPDNYVTLEHFATNSEEKELANYGMMLWGNTNNDYSEASMGYRSNLSFVTYKNRGWSVPHLIGYMESHDEERQMYKNKKYGNSSGSYNIKNLSTGLSRVELTSVFFFTIPGPKLMWQFGELGYDYSINYCKNGGNNQNCRLDPKPIRWDYLDDPNRKHLYDVMSQLMHLKTNDPVFSTTDFEYSLFRPLKTIHLNGQNKDIAILGNFGVTTASINPEFQKTGWWFEYFSGDSLWISNVSARISLQPGEYRLYSNKKIITSTPDIASKNQGVRVFPNPTNGHLNLVLDIENTASLTVELWDISGRKIQTLYNGSYVNGQSLKLDIQQENGVYFIQTRTKTHTFVSKVILR